MAEKKTRRVEQENVVEKFQHLEKIIDNVCNNNNSITTTTTIIIIMFKNKYILLATGNVYRKNKKIEITITRSDRIKGCCNKRKL